MDNNKRNRFDNSGNFYSPHKRTKNNQSNRYQNIKQFIKLNESNALIYIHPSSSYNNPSPEIGNPVEIGILPSESKKKL